MRLFKTLEVVVPPGPESAKLWEKAVRFQFFYSVAGLVLGLACVIGGIILFLHGITGPTANWTTELLGINISDAAPGVILFLVGAIVIWITRFDVKPSQS